MLNMSYIDDGDRKILLDFPEEEELVAEKQEGLPPDKSQLPGIQQTPSAWTWQFYTRFFNVETCDIWMRLRLSLIPRPVDFLADVIDNKPDLYGPIWINITLILLLAWTSDLARCFIDGKMNHWRIFMLTGYRSTVLLFLYNWCLPTTIWIALDWNPINEVKFSLAELYCLYGYSSGVFLPMTIFWTVPSFWLRWTSAALSTTLSGAMICRSLRRGFCSLEDVHFYTIQFLLFALHTIVGTSMVYLFYPTSTDGDETEAISALVEAITKLYSSDENRNNSIFDAPTHS